MLAGTSITLGLFHLLPQAPPILTVSGTGGSLVPRSSKLAAAGTGVMVSQANRRRHRCHTWSCCLSLSPLAYSKARVTAARAGLTQGLFGLLTAVGTAHCRCYGCHCLASVMIAGFRRLSATCTGVTPGLFHSLPPVLEAHCSRYRCHCHSVSHTLCRRHWCHITSLSFTDVCTGSRTDTRHKMYLRLFLTHFYEMMI
jgi:hypothetical protein